MVGHKTTFLTLSLVGIFSIVCFATLSSAAYGYDNPFIPKIPVSLPPGGNEAGGGSNSTFNQTLTDCLYWRLDLSQPCGPPNGTYWFMNSRNFSTVGFINFSLNSGGIKFPTSNIFGPQVEWVNSTGGSLGGWRGGISAGNPLLLMFTTGEMAIGTPVGELLLGRIGYGRYSLAYDNADGVTPPVLFANVSETTNQGVAINKSTITSALDVSGTILQDGYGVPRVIWTSNRTVVHNTTDGIGKFSSSVAGTGDLTLPARFCKTGRTVKLSFNGLYKTAAIIVSGDIFQQQLYLNDKIIFDTGTIAPIVVNNVWRTIAGDIVITCIDDWSVGNGTIQVGGFITRGGTSTATINLIPTANATTQTIDMQVPQFINMSHWFNQTSYEMNITNQQIVVLN